MAAGSELRILSSNSLGETVSASLAVAGDDLFIRGEKQLFCLGG